ncbi:Hint domain-containing protein [Shimia haliotis]|uniref:Hint domain-containing protein n=1 Tax=Shimia haliotis TaxID=1280847 RepID=A0A1I4DAC9_9RHOB|nr:Hint domain-containing protein [Shimia haliotis]SFK90452.1 Hint domain-containing protein [Shimia haliotis]
MSWLALIDKTRTLFRLDGLARYGNKPGADLVALRKPMPTGSLVIETRVSPYDKPQMLLGYAPQARRGIRLSLQAVPGGGVVLVLNRGTETFHTAVNLDTGGRADVIRITYSWDLNQSRGRLSVESPGTFRVAVKDLVDPVALSPQDMCEFVHDELSRVLSPDVIYTALSDRVEPIGPMPTMTTDTPVMTADGYRPVGTLQRGDLVQTAEGEMVPVLNSIKRTVPAAGQFTPIRLRAPFFGLQNPIVVSPTQRLVIGGSRVEYTFGSEYVLVPAGHLLHGTAAKPVKSDPLVTYCQLILPDHEALLVAGTYLESLDLGRIRRRKDVLRASLLGQFMRVDLPEHSQTAYPVLREFEALTLAAQRAA